MKNSKYNVVQEYGNNRLLYNTYTTSLIELEEKMYRDIFLYGLYEEYKEVKILYRLGFLVDSEVDELADLEKVRKKTQEQNTGKISNIIIAPTLECNAHCYYCFEKGFRKGRMSEDVCEQLVAFLSQNWNGEELGITWFGGEPLLEKTTIDKIIQGLIKNKVNFSSKITTNGILLDQTTIEDIQSFWNIDKIQITIDAIGDEYNRIKNYDQKIVDPFSIVMSNIEKIISSGLKLKLRINFDLNKQQRALETMKYLIKRFPGRSNMKIYFAPIDEMNQIIRSADEDLDDYKEHPYISLIKFGRKNNLYRGFPDMEAFSENEDELDESILLKKLKIYPSPINCYATCPNVYSIAPDGKIYKCHRVLGREEFACGDIINGIVKNKAYNFFCNTELAYNECKHCKILPICQGGCKINAKLYTEKEACAPSKSIIKDLILMYKEDMDNFIHK